MRSGISAAASSMSGLVPTHDLRRVGVPLLIPSRRCLGHASGAAHDGVALLLAAFGLGITPPAPSSFQKKSDCMPVKNDSPLSFSHESRRKQSMGCLPLYPDDEGAMYSELHGSLASLRMTPD